MSDQPKQCKAPTKTGRRCRGEARRAGLCLFHDPRNAVCLAEARRRGGFNKRRPREHTKTPQEQVCSAEDVLRLVEAAIADAFKLEASERRCRCVGYLCGVALKAVELAYLTDLETRITALESDRGTA